jgi:hypothetical protein
VQEYIRKYGEKKEEQEALEKYADEIEEANDEMGDDSNLEKAPELEKAPAS